MKKRVQQYDADPIQAAEEGWQAGEQLAHIVDEVTETSSGIQPTSPTPLSGKPSGYMVGSTAPGASEAPQVAVESAKSPKQSAIPEYQAPASRLPDTISAREIYNDRSNPDGCVSGGVQR